MLWVLAITFLAVVVAAGMIYAMACRIPPAYHYRALTAEEQKESLDSLIADHIFHRFGNKAGAGLPFTWTITAARANEYLASLDAVGSLCEPPTYPSLEMERAGLSGPAVAMHQGVLTLMVHAKRYDKIFSTDLAFDFNGQGDLTARTLAMRVGVMPVPQSFLGKLHQQIRRQLAEHLAKAEKVRDRRIGPVPVGDFAKLLRNIIRMADGECIRPELVWPLGKHRVRIDRVEISEGKLSIHFVPVSRARPATATAPVQLGAARTPRPPRGGDGRE